MFKIYSLTLSLYCPLMESTFTLSPSLINNGTLTTAPVSNVAGFVAFVAVFPLTPGSVETTSRITFAGISTDNGNAFSEFVITVTTSPSYIN